MGSTAFANHRGLDPSQRTFRGEVRVIAKLTHSKTLGTVKPVSSPLCLSILKQKVDSEAGTGGIALSPTKENYLLPAPSGSYMGIQHKELRYGTAFAVQTSVTVLSWVQALQCYIPKLLGPLTADAIFTNSTVRLGTVASRQEFTGEMVCGRQRAVLQSSEAQDRSDPT